MKTKTPPLEVYRVDDLKLSFCTLISTFENQNFIFDDSNPLHRYYKGLTFTFVKSQLCLSQKFLKDLTELYLESKIPLLKLNDTIHLFKSWQSSSKIIHLLRYTSRKLNTSINFDDEFWGYLIKYLTVPESEYEACTAKLFLLIKLANNKFISPENWQKHGVLIDLIFATKFSISLARNSNRNIETIISNHYYFLLFWFKNFKKNKADFHLYVEVYAKYYTWTDLKWIDIERQLPFYNNIQNKLPVDYMLYCFTPDILKWFELYELKPSLFQNVILQKEVSNNGFDFYSSLFENFTISGVLISCCYAHENSNLRMNELEKKWFISIINGENIRNQIGLPCTVTKKSAHIFSQLPFDTGLTVKQGIIYSSLLARNVRIEFAKPIVQRIYQYDNLDYWINTLSILFHKGLDLIPLYEVIDYISDQVFEKKRNINFNTKKISNLYSDIEEWHYRISLKKSYDSNKVRTFPTSLIKEFQFEKENRKIRIVQIKNTKELYIEGQQMKHCVVTYNNLCIQNICTIFSLRYSVNFEKYYPIVTIEVRDNKIVQLRGVKNSQCSSFEKEIIQIWANENKLQVD